MTWPSTNPGERRHQVTILQQTTASDISGTVVAWAPFVTTWAKITPMRGTDVIKGGQDTTQLFLTVNIAWQTGIQANMRVQSLNGTYVIRSIQNIQELNVELDLTCIGLGLNE